MTGLGTLLEKARLEQGLTIEEMSARTKIKPQFLQAIEGEDYDVLPGEAYVKPFIRTYAKALGLDDAIPDDMEQPESTPEAVTVERGIRERRERARKVRRRRFVFRLIATLIVLLGSVYLFIKLLNV
ncbi:MAG: helix-turn-helix domain-containing protein [Limnochordia bacterium]|jgi:cytoskeletal protein RodZ|nr:helix-turn-helix domain-containing protein [Limnochordia bacterium]